MDGIKLIVATHKKYKMPKDDIYLPIHVGAYGKDSIGYIRDDSGDNISKKNLNYCELTGLYWAWKNLDSQYLGLVHYRRHYTVMIEDKDGFLYPYINNDKCLKCLRCVKVCHNNKNLKTYKSIFYMGWHKNIEVLKRSSSGGAFTAIADLILERGGVVFGAEFDKNTRRVKHIAIENKKDMDKIRLSKYYQGTIDDSYVMIKELLKNRWVLFSGTACQIAGLYSFLGENYDNLITVDVLCHGVASYKVVNEYILDKERKYKKRIVDFKFRLKPNDADWLNGGMCNLKSLYLM